jgi:hypothetical protein
LHTLQCPLAHIPVNDGARGHFCGRRVSIIVGIISTKRLPTGTNQDIKPIGLKVFESKAARLGVLRAASKAAETEGLDLHITANCTISPQSASFQQLSCWCRADKKTTPGLDKTRPGRRSMVVSRKKLHPHTKAAFPGAIRQVITLDRAENWQTRDYLSKRAL